MRKFLAILLFLFFSCILPVSIIGLGAEQTLLTAEYYKKEFVKQNTYQLVLDSFSAGFRQPGNTELSTRIDGWGVEQIVKNGFSVNWLKTNTEQIIEGVFGLLAPQGKITDLGERIIDFSEPRAQLYEVIKISTEKNINKFPECTNAQLQSLLTANSKITELTCLPANFNDLKDKAPEEISQGLLGVIPERINFLGAFTFFMNLGKQEAPKTTADLFKQLGQAPEVSQYPDLVKWQTGLEEVQLWLKIGHYALWVGIILAGLCLLIIMVLFWKNWRTTLHWWSCCLIWAGINGLGVILPLKLFILQKQFLEPLINSIFNIPAPLAAISTLIFQIIQGAGNGFLDLICWYMGGVLTLGIIILSMSFFIKNKSVYGEQNLQQNSLAQPQ